MILPRLKERFYLIVIISVLVVVPYFFLQHFHIPSKPLTVPCLFYENKIPFVFQAFWLYQSLYLLLFWVAISIKSKEGFYTYAGAVLLTSLICDVFFLFVPTVCPRPEMAYENKIYILFISYELPLNAFPSMHCALATVAAYYYHRIVGSFSLRAFLVFLWVLLICLSTLFIKQHVLFDVFGGILIGLLVIKLKLNPLNYLFNNFRSK